MSLLRTLDRTSAVSNPANARPFLTFLCPALPSKKSRRTFSKTAVSNPPRATHSREHVEAIFIQALVRAGTHHGHAKPLSTLREIVPRTPQSFGTRRKCTWQKHDSQEAKSEAQPQRAGPMKKIRQFAKSELQALVDYYGIQIDTRPEQDPPSEWGSLVWNVGDDHQPWPLRSSEDGRHIQRIEKLLEDDESSHAEIFATYRELPSPGVVYLRRETIRALLHHLSIVERPTRPAMRRFLFILEDMKNANIHIIRSEWTSAIHLTGRAMGAVSSDDLQSALHLWRDMEQRARVKGGFVTLNVLFDLSVKAGKYELAETFLHELKKRKLSLHRHFRVSEIYYHGIMGNGNRVRDAYQALVNAGDIVDTVVLNAVIAALTRAGEPVAAEHVFERMKRLHASKSVTAPGRRFSTRTWRDRRALGLTLTHEARQYRKAKDDDALKELQDYAPVAPNTRTYALLIRYQAATVGDFNRVHDLMQEMRYNDVPLEGTIFIAIFHGFSKFGGIRYSSWTRDKLENIWAQYLKALQDGLERTWVSAMAVIAALKAFAKCTNHDRTLQAWGEIRKLWQPSEDELERVMNALRKLFPPRDGFFDTQRPWM